MFKLFLIPFFLLNVAWAGLSVKGTVKDANNKIPTVAHAHISFLEGSKYDPIKTVAVDTKGQFSFDLEEGRYYTLYITAADHYGFEIPIITDNKNEKVYINAQLKNYTLEHPFTEVKIIGDWNKFRSSRADEMEKQADGSFAFTVKSDKEAVAYQLVGIEKKGHTINGTMQESFKYDGGGDYQSIVKTKNGEAKIIFDPAKLIKNTPADLPTAQITGNDDLSILIGINQKTASEIDKFYSERDESKDAAHFVYDWSSIASFLEKNMENTSSIVRRFAASTYINIIDYGFEKANAELATKRLPINDALWALNAFALEEVFKKAMGDKKGTDHITKNFNQIPSKKVQAAILSMQGLEAKNNDQMVKVAKIHKTLTTEYKDIKDRRLAYYISQLDPSKAITKGKPVPNFNVALIHSDEKVSNESLLGKYYMMDFWAVWCGPCRSEMPKLHEAYNEFNSDKFTILSLSFDPKVAAIDKYRKDKWAMPWLHTFVDGGFNNELSKRFEVTGIPKPVLVNPQGIIVATGGELRGENLKKTLNKYLNTAM